MNEDIEFEVNLNCKAARRIMEQTMNELDLVKSKRYMIKDKPFTDVAENVSATYSKAFLEVEDYIFWIVRMKLGEVEDVFGIYDKICVKASELTSEVSELSEKWPSHFKMSTHADVEAKLRMTIQEFIEVFENEMSNKSY